MFCNVSKISMLFYYFQLLWVSFSCHLGHRFDKTTPIEETMHALHDVVKAGYVRYIGMSSCWAYQRA